MRFVARLTFWPTIDGGYPAPFTQWPARVMLRFPEEGDVYFGAVLYGDSDLVVQPGDVVRLQMELFDLAASERYIAPGRTFPFGDLRGRGEGVVLEASATQP